MLWPDGIILSRVCGLLCQVQEHVMQPGYTREVRNAPVRMARRIEWHLGDQGESKVVKYRRRAVLPREEGGGRVPTQPTNPGGRVSGIGEGIADLHYVLITRSLASDGVDWAVWPCTYTQAWR
jgi:hypothetical protein